jgi:BTB/POZ domain
MGRLSKLCDVSFLIGPERHRMRAHKLVLASNSSVFEKIFYSDTDSQNEIDVTDINKDIFELILNYIYGRDYVVNDKNAVQVLYAADKYNLKNLSKECLKFVTDTIDTSNALDILNDFYHIGNDRINNKCLRIVLNNPCAYLKPRSMHNLKPEVLKRIAESKRINCSTQDLHRVVFHWLKVHGEIEDKSKQFDHETMHKMAMCLQLSEQDLARKEITDRTYLRYESSYTDESVLVDTFTLDSVYLNGVGILVGKFDNETKIEFTINSVYKSLKTITKECPTNVATVQNFFFEKIYMQPEKTCTISVRFYEKRKRPCFAKGSASTFISYLICSLKD